MRFAETLEERYPYRNIKGVDRDVHLIQREFEKNGVKNLSSSDLRQLRKYEHHQLLLERHASGMSKGYWDAYLKAHDGKTPDEVKHVGRYRPNVHLANDAFYLSHPDKYYWDVTQSPRRWIDINEKPRREKLARMKKKQEHEKYIGKNEKARAIIAANEAAKALAKAQGPLTEAEKQQWNEIQNAKKAEAKRLAHIAKRGGETIVKKKTTIVKKKTAPLTDAEKRNEIQNAMNEEAKRLAHIAKLGGETKAERHEAWLKAGLYQKKTAQTKAERHKAWVKAGKDKTRTEFDKASDQTRMGLGLPVVPVVPVTVVPVVVPRAPIVPHGFQHHKDPSDVQFAQTHSDFVAVPRLSWNENAVAKFEGRPITSHESVQQPSHEEPVPQTHVKVI